MAVGYFNPRPAGGAFGGATTVVDPQYQQPPSGLPGWLVPAGLAATGAGAIGGGLALRHLAQQVPTATPAPFNVGYGNGLAQQAGTTAQQQVQQFSAQALQDRLLAQQQAAQFVNQAPVTDLGRGISPADIRVNPVSIPQGAGVGTGTPSMTNLYGSNPYAEAAGVAPASSLPGGVSGIYNFANAPGVDVAAGGNNFLNSGLLGSNIDSGLASKSFGKFGNIGAAIGIPLASQALAGHLSDPTQAANVRAAGNVAGQGAWLTPMIAGHLGIAGVGTLPGIGAAAAGGALAQGFSATDVGNKTINQMRGQDTGNGPADYAAAAAQGLFGALPLVGRAAEKLGFINGSTDNTVADVLGGGSDNAPKANATPQVTPEQRLAASSPEALTKLASDYGLSGPMTQKLIKNYNQALVMAKQQGAVSLPADKDGKLSDGTNAADYPGAKKITDAKGNVQWVTTNPADIQQTVFDQATQLVPTLGASQDQEEDFFRKQAVMQAQLEQVLPQLYNPAIWGSDPTAQTLAMAEARAIPSRYVQAQALQSQQAYQNQIAQAMQQQQLAQQYPELFGKKSSSGQPTTLDAAMNPQ